jgi:hypothetical protein
MHVVIAAGVLLSKRNHCPLDSPLDNTPSASPLALMQPLGRGGYGMVYAAQKIDTGKLYAVKCMGERALARPAGAREVLNEDAESATACVVAERAPQSCSLPLSCSSTQALPLVSQTSA